MKLQLLTAVAVTALMVAPSLATAGEQGWYVRGNVGYGSLTDMDLTGDMVGRLDGNGDIAGSVGVGYAFGNNWRMELDGSQLWNDLGAIGGEANTTADLRLRTGMFNIIYDFSDFGSWVPYIGAGLGVTDSRLNAQAFANIGFISSACPNGSTVLSIVNCRVFDSESGTAWQLIAGLGFDISDRLVWDTQYRYLNVSTQAFEGINNVGGPANRTPITTLVEDAGAHMVLTGFRYRFGGEGRKVRTTKYKTVYSAPAAAMYACADGSRAASLSACVPSVTCWDGSTAASASSCPVQVQCWDGSLAADAAACPVQSTITCWDGSLAYEQASCPVQTYVQSLCANEYRQEIIYYNFNKGQSAETREKIQRILDTATNCAVGNINVIGHTDTSGSAAYNLGLSRRRAADVRQELIRQGVSKAIITSEGKGETQLFIDTGDSVKEQLNRRTEVLISLTETGVVN